jgi:hypothetical protein
MRRPLAVYGIALAVMAGGLALAGILYEVGVRPSWLEGFNLEWRLNSDDRAGVAQRRGSLRLFELALRRDPASPTRWCDYGEALLASGDPARARRAMLRGLDLGPSIAPILMREVEFARRVGDASGALRVGRRLLAIAPTYDDAVFIAWDRMTLPTRDVLASGLPDRRAAQSCLRHALDRPGLAQALEVWAWLRSQGYVDDALADGTASALLKRRETAAAWQAWTSYAGAREPGYPAQNAVFNPGFERDPAGIVFDWRVDAIPGVTVGRDLAVAAEGKASLRLDFDRTANVSDCGVSQRIILSPGAYYFEARMRTVDITTDQGLGFRVFDPANTGFPDVSTGRLTGTHDWTLLSVSFNVRPAAQLVEVRVVRAPSLKFDNKLGGTAWIDSLVLRRDQATARATRRQP